MTYTDQNAVVGNRVCMYRYISMHVSVSGCVCVDVCEPLTHPATLHVIPSDLV